MEDLIKYCEGNEEVINWVKTVLKAAISNHDGRSVTEIEHILDYLKSDAAPKRLRKMSYDQAKISADKWSKRLIKKAGKVIETEVDVEVVYSFKSGMRLVKLVGEAAYKREGHLMRHCVSSYYESSSSTIYSLRDSSNNPHCTIEVTKDGDQIQQIKGKGNGEIHPKYIKYIIKILTKYFKLPVRDSELTNLGYLYLDGDEWAILESLSMDIKPRYLMFNNKKYLYMNDYR